MVILGGHSASEHLKIDEAGVECVSRSIQNIDIRVDKQFHFGREMAKSNCEKDENHSGKNRSQRSKKTTDSFLCTAARPDPEGDGHVN